MSHVEKWTSAPICDDCWTERNPDRQPYRMRGAPRERCFYCGVKTLSGIYVRALVEKS